MFSTNFPAFVNGKKNNTKMSFVSIQRNVDIEKALQEYVAKGQTKVSLKKATKVEKNVTFRAKFNLRDPSCDIVQAIIHHRDKRWSALQGLQNRSMK